MVDDISRTLNASKVRMQKTAKNRVIREGEGEGARFRNSPAGRRLAELRKRKLDKDS